MDLSSIKSYQRTIASVQVPILHFLETGFWNPYALPSYEEHDISEQQVRRKCRQIARELKRPFIQCYASLSWHDAVPTGEVSQWGNPVIEHVKRDTPKFSMGYVEMPKQKRLAPLMAALSLLPKAGEKGNDSIGWQAEAATLWQFRISDEKAWTKIYDFLLNDPDCRKARGLTS